MNCSGAPQATLGGSWSLQNHNSSALSVSQSPQEAPCRLSEGFLSCSGVPHGPLGGSWRLSELAKSRSIGPVGVPEASREPHRSSPSHDPSALSGSGRRTSQDQSCLSASGGFQECSEVTIHRACGCLEASQKVPGCNRTHPESRSLGPVVSGMRTSHDPSCTSMFRGSRSAPTS